MLSLLNLILIRNQLRHNIGIIDSTGIGLLSIIGTSWTAPSGNIVDTGFIPGITGTRDGATPICPSKKGERKLSFFHFSLGVLLLMM